MNGKARGEATLLDPKESYSVILQVVLATDAQNSYVSQAPDYKINICNLQQKCTKTLYYRVWITYQIKNIHGFFCCAFILEKETLRPRVLWYTETWAVTSPMYTARVLLRRNSKHWPKCPDYECGNSYLAPHSLATSLGSSGQTLVKCLNNSQKLRLKVYSISKT